MSKNRKIKDTSARSTDRRREVLGVLGLGAGLFLLVAMLSLQANKLVMGPFGKSSAGLFYGLAGVCGYALIALAVVAAVRTLIERDPVMPPTVAGGTLIGVISLATLVHLAASSYRVVGHGPGGAIGEHLAEVLRAVISTAGTALLALIGLVVAVVIATPLRMGDVLHAIGRVAQAAGRGIAAGVFAFAKFWADVFRAILPGRDDDDDDVQHVEDEDVPGPTTRDCRSRSANRAQQRTTISSTRSEERRGGRRTGHEIDFSSPRPSIRSRAPRSRTASRRASAPGSPAARRRRRTSGTTLSRRPSCRCRRRPRIRRAGR